MKGYFNVLVLGIVSAFLLILGLLSYRILLIPHQTPVACTQEAKECPDGSYVGRIGPNCEFAACPTATSTQQGTGTLQGTMTIGPICPVEQVGHPCNPTAAMYAAHPVFVYAADKKTLIKTLTPDAAGNFSVTLPVGNYSIDVEHQSIGGITGVPATISLVAGKTTSLAITIDTGIR